LQVPGGTYDVRLHFADPVHTTGGKRKFNVYAESNLVLNRFDVAGYGGGKAKLVRSLIVNVADGALDLRFRGVVDNAILSAIEVVPRNPDGWTGMTAAPRGTTESMAAAISGKMYVFGGFFDTGVQALRASNVYDPDADTWTKIADLPRPITGGATAADGNTVWLAGGIAHDASGKLPQASVWKYDSIRDAWTAGPALPKALANAAMVRVGRKLRVFGGVDASGVDSADQYVLDLDLPQLGWRTSAPLPVARHHLGATVVNGKVYAIGGQRGADPVAGRVTDVDVYDWVTNRWTSAAPLPIARSHIGSSTFVGLGNKITVAGGVTNGASAASILSDVIEYNPATNAWSHKEWMPSLRSAPVARILANRLVVTTGASGPTSPEATTWTLLL
jgi:N-acetylneuraminic acid mutarotase